MGRQLRCTRALSFFGREFAHGEEFDADEFAEVLGRGDPDWLYEKM